MIRITFRYSDLFIRQVTVMRLIIVTIFLLLLQSCGDESIDPSSVEGKLGARIKTACTHSDVCRIRVKDVTDFDWDKMYVFKHTASPAELEKVLAAPIPQYNEFTKKTVFVKAGRLVYSEAVPINVERPIRDEIVFDIPSNAIYRSYGPDAFFIVTKKAFSDGEYFELKLAQE